MGVRIAIAKRILDAVTLTVPEEASAAKALLQFSRWMARDRPDAVAADGGVQRHPPLSPRIRRSRRPPQPPWWVDVIAVPVGLALLIGFLTPIASVCAAIGNAAIAILCYAVTVTGPNPKLWSVLYLAAMSLALLMLGPGAFSLDARLFGRREIIIPKAAVPRGCNRCAIVRLRSVRNPSIVARGVRPTEVFKIPPFAPRNPGAAPA
jgi:uncharacterized membrane protein YphA (DoxX/SURF4 family)